MPSLSFCLFSFTPILLTVFLSSLFWPNGVLVFFFLYAFHLLWFQNQNQILKCLLDQGTTGALAYQTQTNVSRFVVMLYFQLPLHSFSPSVISIWESTILSHFKESFYHMWSILTWVLCTNWIPASSALSGYWREQANCFCLLFVLFVCMVYGGRLFYIYIRMGFLSSFFLLNFI